MCSIMFLNAQRPNTKDHHRTNGLTQMEIHSGEPFVQIAVRSGEKNPVNIM